MLMRKIYVIMIILFSVLLVSCNFGNDLSMKNIDKVFQVKSSNENDEVISYGSAIVFNNEGILITNAHVISYFAMGIQSIADHIYVKDNEKNDYREVAVLKYDFKKDIAFLFDSTIIGKETPIFSLTDLAYNEEVYVLGNFNNFGISLSRGYISMPKIRMNYLGEENEFIQVDATVSNGNSGGALFNSKNELIGVVSFRVRDSSGIVIQGMCYCIPIDRVISFFNQEN